MKDGPTSKPAPTPKKTSAICDPGLSEIVDIDYPKPHGGTTKPNRLTFNVGDTHLSLGAAGPSDAGITGWTPAHVHFTASDPKTMLRLGAPGKGEWVSDPAGCALRTNGAGTFDAAKVLRLGSDEESVVVKAAEWFKVQSHDVHCLTKEMVKVEAGDRIELSAAKSIVFRVGACKIELTSTSIELDDGAGGKLTLVGPIAVLNANTYAVEVDTLTEDANSEISGNAPFIRWNC